MSGLLAVHAHPDDETLATGALLAAWASAGLPVTLVTCTRGEQGEVIGAALAHLEGDGPALAAHREAELTAALAALGVSDHVFLDRVRDDDVRYADSGMAWAAAGRATAGAELPDDAFVAAPLDEAARRLADVLLDRRPAVVVGYEPGGGYGHPDHVRAHEVMHRAVELAADDADRPHRPAAVLWAAVDEDLVRHERAALVAAVRGGRVRPGAGLEPAAPDGAVGSAAVPSGSVDVVVDLAPAVGRVVAALEAHATQVTVVRTDDGAAVAWALSNGVLEPLLPTESYRLAAGTLDDVVLPAGVHLVPGTRG